jgi:hypothetical protein
MYTGEEIFYTSFISSYIKYLIKYKFVCNYCSDRTHPLIILPRLAVTTRSTTDE